MSDGTNLWMVFLMRSPLCGLILLLLAPILFAQQKPRSHEECIKEVPGDWGPNFGDQWHGNEARYWACRLGVPIKTVREWQQAVHEEGMANEIKPVVINGQELVLFVEVNGTAHCCSLTILRQIGSNWLKAWELPAANDNKEDYYCSGPCPALRATTNGAILTVRSASSGPNDEQCKQVHWESERFRWDGETFRPVN